MFLCVRRCAFRVWHFLNGRRGNGNHFEVKTYFCDAIAMKPHRNNPWDI